jgi:hypothetical protein
VERVFPFNDGGMIPGLAHDLQGVQLAGGSTIRASNQLAEPVAYSVTAVATG